VDLGKILQTSIKQIDLITARKLMQATPKECTIFLEMVDKHFNSQNLYQRLRNLTAIKESEWDMPHTAQFKQCDKTMVAGMLVVESTTKKTNTTAWSPTFTKAVTKKMFWKLALSLKINHRRPSPKYLEWSRQFGINDFQSLNLDTIKQNHRAAQS
jgi:hypothetical protein